MRWRILIITAASAFTWSCKTPYQSSTIVYNNYRISAQQQKDSSLNSLLKPYTDSVNKNMNDVIGHVETTLEKALPESTLGNFMADAMLKEATRKFNKPVDAAFVNYGGVRLQQIIAGPITRSKIYELMPFDNLIVLQILTGSQLQQFLNNIAARGGWPCAGVHFVINNNKATNVVISNKPLDMNANYTIANSDYVANGGDESNLLKTIPQQNINYLMRDALLDYVIAFQHAGKKINVQLQNRITNAQ
jgi:2',3'-cyclic-nucleotide 2'-phosphodiesterase (5'-nucleotidase family)